MSLRYFQPQSTLQPHIRTFSVLQEPKAVFNKRVILPDSYPALVINLGSPLVWEIDDGHHIELPRAFFIRVQTRPLKLRATGTFCAIGANLASWGTRFLVDRQVDLTASPIVPLYGVWQDLTRLLEKTLLERGEKEAILTLEQFTIDLHRRVHIDVTTIRAAVEVLSTNNGHFSLNELAAHCYLSPSQLDRQAKYFTGQTPRTLARLIRFDAVCAGLLNDPVRLTDLAHTFGYVDQPHFIREFRAFAACTPRQARTYIHRLAADAEFIQFS